MSIETKEYMVGSKSYTVSIDQEQKFLEKFPEAKLKIPTTDYLVDGKKYTVSEDQKENFLTQFSNAEEVEGKDSSSTIDAIIEQMREASTQETDQSQINQQQIKINEDLKVDLTTGELIKSSELKSGDGSLDSALLNKQQYEPTEEQLLRIDEETNSYIKDIMKPGRKKEVKTRSEVEYNIGFDKFDAIQMMDQREVLKHNEEVDRKKKEWKELSNRAKEALLRKHNSTLEEPIMIYDENGNETEEYLEWLNSVSQEDIINEATLIKGEENRDEQFYQNVKNKAEEGLHLLSFLEGGMSEDQKKEKLLAQNARAELDNIITKNLDAQELLKQDISDLVIEQEAYTGLSKELKSIESQLRELTSKEYATQEERDNANLKIIRLQDKWRTTVENYGKKGGRTYDELEEKKNAILKAHDKLINEGEDIVKKEEELGPYLDAIGRKYGFLTSTAIGTANSFIKMRASIGEYLNKMAPLTLIEEWEEKHGEVPGITKDVIEKAWWLASAISPTVKQLDILADRGYIDAAWNLSEQLDKGIQKPISIDEVDSAYDMGEWFAGLVSSQAANTAVIFSPLGVAALPVLGMSAAGSKMRDMDKEEEYYANLPEFDEFGRRNEMHNFKYSFAQQYVVANLSGIAEGASEYVSIGQARAVKSLLLNNPQAKRGFRNFLYRNLGTKRGLYMNVYQPIEEGFSESLAELSNNILDKYVSGDPTKRNISLWENMDESFASGVFMSGAVYKAPLIGKNLRMAFQSTNVTNELRTISADIAEIEDKLKNPDLSKENKEHFISQIEKLVGKHTKLLNETVTNIDKLTPQQRADLIFVDVETAKLRQSNQDLQNDTSLSAEEIKAEQDKNNARIAELTNYKNQTLGSANESENISQIERSTKSENKRAEKIFGKENPFTLVDESNIESETKRLIQEQVESIDKKIKEKQRKIDLIRSKGVTQGNRKELEELKSGIKELKQDRIDVQSLTVEDVKNTYGVIGQETGSILINKNLAGKRGQVGVAHHEMMHKILKNTLAGNPSAAIVLGNALDSYLMQLDPDQVAQSGMANRILAYKNKPEAVRAEEKIALFLDAIITGDIKFNKTGNTRIKDAFRRILQTTGLSKGEIKLNTAEDVYNFVTDFAWSSNSIFHNKAIAKGAKEGFKIGESLIQKFGVDTKKETKKDTKLKKSKDTQFKFSKDTGPIINDMALAFEFEGGNKLWKENSGEYINQITEGKMLDGLILSYTSIPIPRALQDKFKNDVYTRLSGHIRNYKPESQLKYPPAERTGLYGWINAFLKNKVLDVQKRPEYSPDLLTRAKDITEKTEEGAPKYQPIADNEIADNFIDNIGATEVEQELDNSLRKDIGLNDNMVSEVRLAVLNVFKNNLPDFRSPKFKKELKKQYENLLHDKIKKYMGSSKKHEQFLKDNREAIINNLPMSNLVAMERLQENKIFGKKIKKLTTVEEIERAVTNELLPPNAMNKKQVWLYEKRTPTEQEFMDFFFPPLVNPTTGKKDNTRGERKKALSTRLAVQLGFDATMETIQELENSKTINQTLKHNNKNTLEDQLSVIAQQVGRSTGYKFSADVVQVEGLLNSIEEFGYENVIQDGRLNDDFKIKGQKIDQVNVDLVNRIFDKGNILSAPEMGFIRSVLTSDIVPLEVKQEFITEGTLNKDNPALDTHLKDMETLIKDLGKDVVNAVGYDIFGFTSRYLDPAARKQSPNWKKGDPVENKWKKDKDGNIVEGKHYKDLQRIKKEISKYKSEIIPGVKLSDISIMNKMVSGVFNDAKKIIESDTNVENKINELKKLQTKIQSASNSNIALFKHIVKRINKLSKQGKISKVTALHFLQKQTNLVKGLRGLSKLELFYVADGSQKATKQHPLYKEALAYYKKKGNKNPEEAAIKNLTWKGEHVGPSSNTNSDIVNLLFNNKLSDAEIDIKLDEILDSHSQFIAPKYILDILDEGGRTSKENFKRISKFLPKKHRDKIRGLNGESFYDFMVDKTIQQAGYNFSKDSKIRLDKSNNIKKAHDNINKYIKDGKTIGMSTFDFDETLIIDGKNFVVATNPITKEKIKVSSADWPTRGTELAEQGYEFDFSDFVNVRGGKDGPLLDKMKNQITKYGSKNVFVLTARPQESVTAIHGWLKAKNIDIPIYNITGLGDSRGEAKADWMLDKFAEGYNDMYFVDDALSNVDAVKEVLDQLDIKSKVVQAKTKVKVGNWLIDVTTKEGRDFIKKYNSIETVSTTDPDLANRKIKFSKDANKIIDKFNEQMKKWREGEGKKMYEEMQKIPTVRSSEFKRMGRWIVDTRTEEGKKFIRDYENIPTVSSSEFGPGHYEVNGKLYKGKYPNGKLVDPKGGIKFSKDTNIEFNEILEQTKGVGADKIFSAAEARKIGVGKGKNIFKNFFVPPSAEDFKGLLYAFIGKGEQGNAHAEFFKKKLLDPFARASRDWNNYKQAMSNDYKSLKKKFKSVGKILNKKVKGSVFTNDAAIRVYLWDKAGFEIPGLTESQKQKLVDHVNNNPNLKNFAEGLGAISRTKDGYIEPGEFWPVESIASDLSNIVSQVGRKEFFAEWIENKNIIFSPENLNKIEATYGTSFRNELEKMLYRMETGRNRLTGKDSQVNWMLDWINGSVGAVMFFNMRSATLQTISMANFINMSDNNPVAAAAALANAPQFIKDFTMIFNSDMLKQRRAGLQIDVSASELTKAFYDGRSKPQAIIAWLLEKGFTPTQIADSFAIAAGGAPFYRNRFNNYIKQGMTPKDAKKQAWLDFQEVAEETQQSSRPDLISNQQAGPLGRLILAWQNTPMQMTRLMKKKMSDFINRRRIPGYSQFQSDMANISGIAYYGLIQNIYFGALQTGLMFMLFGWDEDEEKKSKLEQRVANGALDSILRGTGIYGAGVSTLKNVLLKWKEEADKPGWKRENMNIAQEAVNLSPPMGTKMRKIMQAVRTEEWNKGVSKEIGWRIENPNLNIAANWIEALTNAPIARLINKANNIEEALTGNHELWQRIALIAGWSKWSVGVEDEELQKAKAKVKIDKEEARKKEREDKKKEKEKQEEAEKKKKGIKTVRCSGIKSNGKRCSLTTETSAKTWKCMHHMAFKDGMDRDGDGIKEYRCTAKTGSGKRCKNKTENKNKRCYAHQ